MILLERPPLLLLLLPLRSGRTSLFLAEGSGGLAPPEQRQAASDEGGAGLSSQTCSISQSSRGGRRRVNHDGSWSNRDGRQRQVRATGAGAGCPWKAAEEWCRTRAKATSSEWVALFKCVCRGCCVGWPRRDHVCPVVSLLAKVDVISELRSPAVRRRPPGRPITGGAATPVGRERDQWETGFRLKLS